TFDTSRPKFDAAKALDPSNGRVTKIEWDSQRRVGADQYDTVLFDLARAKPWSDGMHDEGSKFHVATNLYIASFAAAAGVQLKDKDGFNVTLAKSIVKRGDGSEVKDYEAFAAYLKTLSDGN